jgi:hypothetical protein
MLSQSPNAGGKSWRRGPGLEHAHVGERRADERDLRRHRCED